MIQFLNRGGGGSNCPLSQAEYDECLELSNDILSATPDVGIPLKFIQNDGSQFIDTGIIASSKIELEVSHQLLSDSGGQFGTIIGGQKNSPDTGIFFMSRLDYDSKNKSFRYNTEEKKITIENNYAGTDAILTLKDKMFKLQIGEEEYVADYSQQGVFDSGVPLWIFTLNNGGRSFGTSKAKIYYIKIWENGNLVSYLLPYLDDKGVACLYDKVRRKFLYPNSGALIGG